MFLVCLISSAARLLFQFDYVYLFRDSTIQANLMGLAAPSIDGTKLVNIFHTTKNCTKNFQNIFINFFSLPREKVFSAQRAIFFDFWQAKQFDAGTQVRYDL